MRRFLAFLMIISMCSVVSAARNTRSAGKLLSAKATVSLKGQKDSSERFLDLLKGASENLPKKLLRKIKLTNKASSSSTSLSFVQNNSDDPYEFTVALPSILRGFISSKKLQKIKVTSTNVVVSHSVLASSGSGDGGTDSLGDTFSSSKTIRKKLKKKALKRLISAGSTGFSFDIKKAVALRKGKKGRFKGTFEDTASKAKGRFLINFKYQ